jgi:16S rRNA (uracil1498-N3)-methyltransferase
VAILPIVTARTEIALSALARSRRRERWERIAVSSAKQCGRAVVPAVSEPVAFDPAALSDGSVPQPVLALVEPNTSAGIPLSSLDTPESHATLVVGPEGGWTAEEVQALSAFSTLVTLGGRTLRADAAALVALAALFVKCGEY